MWGKKKGKREKRSGGCRWKVADRKWESRGIRGNDQREKESRERRLEGTPSGVREGNQRRVGK